MNTVPTFTPSEDAALLRALRRGCWRFIRDTRDQIMGVTGSGYITIGEVAGRLAIFLGLPREARSLFGSLHSGPSSDENRDVDLALATLFSMDNLACTIARSLVEAIRSIEAAVGELHTERKTALQLLERVLELQGIPEQARNDHTGVEELLVSRFSDMKVVD